MSAGTWTQYCRNGHLVHQFGECTEDYEGDHLRERCEWCGSEELATAHEESDIGEPIGLQEYYQPFMQILYTSTKERLILPAQPYIKVAIPVFNVSKLFEERK